MKKIALLTGITGQDGSFLAEFLIEKGYTRTTQSKTLPERRASRQCAPSTAISANW